MEGSVMASKLVEKNKRLSVSVLIHVSFALPMTSPGGLNWGVDHPYAETLL